LFPCPHWPRMRCTCCSRCASPAPAHSGGCEPCSQRCSTRPAQAPPTPLSSLRVAPPASPCAPRLAGPAPRRAGPSQGRQRRAP
jgi:hypothetical protein